MNIVFYGSINLSEKTIYQCIGIETILLMGQDYVKLKILDKLIHFSPSLYFGLAFAIIIVLLIVKGIFNLEILTMLGLVFSPPIAVLYAVQKSKLKFKLIKTSVNREELKDLVNEISQEYKWTIYSCADNEFSLKTNPGFLNQTWGQHITLKLTTDGILLNSIFDTNKGTSLITFGSNTKNISDIEQIIKKKTEDHLTER